MPNQQPIIQSHNGERSFACSPAAVVVMVVDAQERFLLGRHLRRNRWEVVSGALEARETLVDGALRELREEMGAAIRARPLGVFHANTFRYDENAQYMLSIYYLMAYEGGSVEPGDDMAPDQFRWARAEEIANGSPIVCIPSQSWVFDRAIDCYRQWRGQDVQLQPT
ncbi:MAG: NUDIX domain-containing protein [Gammaproteobacteria bacterium]|nr:NUDIX domain-containing protein [Gammaproteobacteria bacterium]